MKNKYEGYCYVCGELVEEEKGIAEKVHESFISPTAPGFGEYRWCVRHGECPQPTKRWEERQSDTQTKQS